MFCTLHQVTGHTIAYVTATYSDLSSSVWTVERSLVIIIMHVTLHLPI